MFTPPRDRGAAAVEFALVLPVLLLVVIGIIEFGRAYQVQTILSNAARDGVRVMALQNSVTATRSTVKASAPDLPLTDSMIRVTPLNCRPTDSSPPGSATVEIVYPLSWITGFLPIDDLTLKGTGTMRCNG